MRVSRTAASTDGPNATRCCRFQPVAGIRHPDLEEAGLSGAAGRDDLDDSKPVAKVPDDIERQRLKRRVAELKALADRGQPILGNAADRHEPPGGNAGDEDDAAIVDDVGRGARGVPIRLDIVEFHLDDDDAQETVTA